MDTIFMNSENSKTSEYHVLVFKLTNKLDLRRGQKTFALSNLSIYYTWKNIKSSHTIIINLKYLLQRGMKNLSYRMDHIQYQIFKIILNIFSRNTVKVLIIHQLEYLQIELKIELRLRYLELLTPETMKLLRSTESKITKNKNGQNVPHLEVVELVLVHCNLVNNDYQQDSRILYTFVPNKAFGSLLEISPTIHVFLKTFNSEFQAIKIWFTDQTSKPLELADKKM